jgi:superfamily II DNA or RNA helicase
MHIILDLMSFFRRFAFFICLVFPLSYKDGHELRPWQIDGVNQLLFCWYNRRGVILADEMGLGKTVQTVATFMHIREKYSRGPFLVVVPLSTLNHWKREFQGWTSFNTVVYQGSRADRDAIQHYEFRFWDAAGHEVHGMYKFEVLICTFESLMADSAQLSQIPFKGVAIDEAHRIKNKESKLFRCLKLFHTEFRLLLTGTPIQNNIEELWTLLNFIDPAAFASQEAFSAEYGNMSDNAQVVKLQTLLRPYMLRRIKEDVAKHIPPKEETVIEVELTSIQKQYYRAVLERNQEFLYKGLKGSNVPKLLNIVMQLRKVCNHPFLIKGAREKLTAKMQQQQVLDRLIESSGKLVLVDKLLPKLKADGHKVLIFSQLKMVLDLIEEYVRLRQYVFERIDGDVRGNERQSAIDRFCKPDSDRFVFLLCTRAGGQGINLAAADTVIIFDSDWNPQNDVQAQARCHRVGQTKEVKVYRLVTAKTYEQKMFMRASMKLGLDQAVLTNMRVGASSSSDDAEGGAGKLGKQDIDALLKYGAYDMFKDDDDSDAKMFVQQDIDEILSKRSKVWNQQGAEARAAMAEGGSTFSKATFAVSSSEPAVDLEDSNFWQKIMPSDTKSAAKLWSRLEEGSVFMSDDSIDSFMADVAEQVDSVIAMRNRGLMPADMDLVMSTLDRIIRLDPSDFSDKDREQARDWIESIENPRRARRTGQAAVMHSAWLVSQGLDMVCRGLGRFGRKSALLPSQVAAAAQIAAQKALEEEAVMIAEATIENMAATRFTVGLGYVNGYGLTSANRSIPQSATSTETARQWVTGHEELWDSHPMHGLGGRSLVRGERSRLEVLLDPCFVVVECVIGSFERWSLHTTDLNVELACVTLRMPFCK